MSEQHVVNTQSGPVQGRCAEGVCRWLGIPYATAERFGAPAPVAPWTDLKSATDYGPVAPSMLEGTFDNI